MVSAQHEARALTDGCQLLLVRHGETEWSRSGRHTGATDLEVTPRGEEQARALAPVFAAIEPSAVLVSPRQRARRTGELAGLRGAQVEPDLAEWDYGDLEGVTTRDFVREHPGWDIWVDGPPGGESVAALGARLDRVLERAVPLLEDGHPVVLVAHGHALRVLAARWLGLAPQAGALLRLDPASVSGLGFEHDRHVLTRWNAFV